MAVTKNTLTQNRLAIAVSDDVETLAYLACLLRAEDYSEVIALTAVSEVIQLRSERSGEFDLAVSDVTVGSDSALEIWRFLNSNPDVECAFILLTDDDLPADVAENSIAVRRGDLLALKDAIAFLRSLRPATDPLADG